MKRIIHLLLAVMFPLLLLGENVAAAKPPHIVLVGDSTVTDFEGWGLGFRQFVAEGAMISNAAQNGRSSKSYRDEGLWAKALALKGDYYLIQFGHNDEPGKGLARETDAATTYAQNMARYVDDVRAIGAIPILVTSLVRRNFDPIDPGKIKSGTNVFDPTVTISMESRLPQTLFDKLWQRHLVEASDDGEALLSSTATWSTK